MKTNILALAITLTLGVILVGSIMVPVIDDATDKDEKILNVVVLGGQSNGVYIPGLVDLDLLNEEVPQPPAACLFYGNGYLHSMTTDGRWTLGSVDPAIAYEIAKYSNNDTLVINTCVGGKSIDYFTPGNEGADFITETVTTAMSRTTNYDTIYKIGWAWIQGESDKTTPVDDYIANFEQVDGLFKSLGFNYCWISQTRTEDGGNAVTAQEQIVNTMPNVFWGSRASDSFTVENGMLYTDGLHYTQAGRIVIGEDIGSAMTANVPFSLKNEPTIGLLYVIPLITIVALVAIAARSFLANRRD